MDAIARREAMASMLRTPGISQLPCGVVYYEALNDRQRAFTREYPTDWNATHAAIRAGYSRRTARQQATRLLSNVAVQDALRERCDRLAEKHDVDQERVIAELCRIAFSDPKDAVRAGTYEPLPLDEMDPNIRGALRSIEADPSIGKLRLILHDKLRALELLGRYLDMWNRADKDENAFETHIKRIELVDRRELGCDPRTVAPL